ncbi:MAG: O-linked N-acetylglucosamine transferase family protein [Nostoc sp.]|uniref:O-linked N-acetylglucosamine transferase family protein n=1 Tax=Nostoc sp. TaxID=1180 RepID=UPI002FFCA9BF
MNILIDGYVFARQDETELHQFWKQVIPKIVNRLQNDQVYLLNRTSNPIFQENSSKFKNLFAPLVDFEKSAIEDRRLAALCQELDINIFISTYYTSAGAVVQSVFILCDKFSSNIFETDYHISLSRQRAIKMASSYIAIFPDEVDNFSATYKILENRIRVVYPTVTNTELDREKIAEQFAIAIQNVFDEKLSPEIITSHIAEEEAVKYEASFLTQDIEKAALDLWETERKPKSYVSTQKPFQTLSVCMMVQNSEKTLALALESLNEIYDDLIIVDGGSTDSTCQIALSYGAKIIYSRWKGNHAEQRNVYLKEVKTDWVFAIDSDEFIDKKTLDFLNLLKTNGSNIKTDNIWVTRKWISTFSKNYYISNNPHYPDWQRRIFRYSEGISYSGQIHEEINGLMNSGECLADLSVYHLDLLVKSESERQAKVNAYTKVNQKDGMPHFYLPNTKELILTRWNHEDLLVQTKILLDSIPIKCKVCESDLAFIANAKVLGKYQVDYFQCSNCGFVQTEEPFWLQEAYSKAIASTDVGLVFRNLIFSSIASKLIFNFFNHEAKFLDYGGGYGLFVRLMRDNGFDFYWIDKFCENIFAKGFEFLERQDNQTLKLEMATAFEVVEHLVNPVNEIREILKYSRNFLFSTELLPNTNSHPDEWHYYSLDEGQHISLYTHKSLAIIAKKLNLNFYSNGSSLHLFTEKDLPDNLFVQLANADLKEVKKKSFLQDDYIKAVSEIHKKNEHYQSLDELQGTDNNGSKPKIVVDGVFFQLNQSGIARVWKSLLEEWVKSGFAKHIIVLDRAGTAPKIPGIRYRNVPVYDYSKVDADRTILQEICDEEDVDVFISSYYTTPITTPSVFMAYDMVPEVLGWDMNNPMWQAKHHGIQYASAYIAISENTADDLAKFFPHIPIESITRAYCGIKNALSPAEISAINAFTSKYDITKPYFLLVGAGGSNKNIILFFQAFAQLANSYGFEIVLTGSGDILTPELRTYTSGSIVHMLQLSDEELAIAYSGAVALVYPSIYEGFGMPLVEAMACGCPVITCPNSSIPEVAGEAAIYVNHDDVDGLTNALCEVQKPSVRQSLITTGFAQAKKFSWSKMANTVSDALVDASILYLNLNEINLIIFPDWSQSEDLISLDLERVIKTLAAYSGSHKTTLIIDTSDIASEDAAILVSGVTMNLLMQEDLDVNEGLEISLGANLANIQWTALLPRISARIILEYENKQAVIKCQKMLEQGNKLNGLIEQCDIKEFIHSYELNNKLHSLVAIYKQENSDTSVLKELRLLRRQIAESWIGKEEELLERLYLSRFGEAYQVLLNSGIQNESITGSEQSFITDILARYTKGFNEQNAIQYLLVAMLYCRPHQLPSVYDLTKIPSWLLNDYLKFTFKPPLYFQEIGEADNYCQYMENFINYLHRNIISNSESKFWQDIAEFFTYTANFIPLYFNKANLKNVYTKRADIIKSYLQEFNQSIEYEFPECLDERVKIRVGILASHFGPQTETFATLSVYKHLNRDFFEVILFTLNVSNHRLERYCVGHVDALIQLPTNLTNQVQTIREYDLDILFISTNITAVTHQITLLSLYRLARIQMVDANSPVTTGITNIDYYISSKLSETEDNAQEHYTEQLITLNSPPQCFDFATEEQILATSAINRESLGIEKTAIVYVSGANYYKIIPEQEVTWAKIIASVPNSVLLLYPFNPNWSSSYPCIAFRKRLITTFAKYGLSEDRLIILDPAPNRADVKERLKLCDIYLDSYPYSGMTSLIDPLEVGLPTVVMETEPSRSRKGASLLRELQIFDLITNSEEAYIELAAVLGISSELRRQQAEQINQKMHQNPIFLDSRSHSAQMGELFQELFYKHQMIALKEQLNLKDINLIIFPDWSQPEDLLYQDLASVISTLTTHPDKSNLTLLIDTQNITEEEADMLLSSLTMNLLMEDDVDITEGPEISLLGKMSHTQWKTLLPRIHTRIALVTDNQSAIAQAKVENLPSCDVDSLTAY